VIVLAALLAVPALDPVPPSDLRVTQGALRDDAGALRVDGPRLRAEAPGREVDRAEVRFTYLGPSVETVALGSGAERRQLGLKLRSLDACNVLYAMWRFAPQPGVVVQLKRNPGQRSSSACGNAGYVTVRPELSLPVPPPAPGEVRALRADLEGGRLSVRVDGRLVWDGALPPEVDALRGPVGLRADNARVRLVLATSRSAAARGPEPGPTER
jgi:hypothetical protein